MTLLTLISAPKPFRDPVVSTIQGNALRSWSRLPGVEVFVVGEEDGIAAAAARAGAVLIRGVRRNDSGTPLISSMAELARQRGSGDLLCIINADIIIMRDLLEAARSIAARAVNFVMLSRRWDLHIEEALDFSEGWEQRLRERTQRNGILHRPAGSDLFVFPRSCYPSIPDFAVGRAGWDNWMIYQARRSRWSVIDCTSSVMVIHQNHEYNHLPGGMPHYSVPESDENIRLAGGHGPIRYTILDATHCLAQGRLVRPPLTHARFVRGVELLLRAVFFFLPPGMIEEVSRPKRWKKRLMRLVGMSIGRAPAEEE
jgi:hypothetical protein